MGSSEDLTTDNEFFSAQPHGPLLIIREKKQLTRLAADLPKIDDFYDFHEAVAQSRDIKVIVRFGSPDKRGFTESAAFLCNVLRSREEAKLLHRYFNVINNHVLALARLDKITVHADRGMVGMSHLNLSLAYDYRLITEDTVFENAYADIGLIPKGGGGYFMSRLLGVKKATEVMLWSRFNAEEALNMGLVDKVVPQDKLEEAALRVANNYLSQPVAGLLGIRKLLKCDLKELERGLELEDHLIFSRINDPEFKKAFEGYLCGRAEQTLT
ncbi:MAG: enoyl-CoA hydratase/isomerase family protein [Desulfovibrionaceae bacterium]|nr:enoyl-CoA hydratase/isomerase family protein [Desulfovibrionaceae bacterium]MBF0514165.1 enoyl-CoA hydratase/isomerase family protein [Desulfovibrionaceae bacterium]